MFKKMFDFSHKMFNNIDKTQNVHKINGTAKKELTFDVGTWKQ